MTENSSSNPVGPLMRSPLEAERDRAMKLGIAFNGTQFTYRDFKYDRLRDAMAYADLDSQRAGHLPDPSLPEEWLEQPLPGVEDMALMQQHGISLERFRYRYRGYLYDRLADALSYAGRHGVTG